LLPRRSLRIYRRIVKRLNEPAKVSPAARGDAATLGYLTFATVFNLSGLRRPSMEAAGGDVVMVRRGDLAFDTSVPFRTTDELVEFLCLTRGDLE
jgi:hypothetical protein